MQNWDGKADSEKNFRDSVPALKRSFVGGMLRGHCYRNERKVLRIRFTLVKMKETNESAENIERWPETEA